MDFLQAYFSSENGYFVLKRSSFTEGNSLKITFFTLLCHSCESGNLESVITLFWLSAFTGRINLFSIIIDSNERRTI